MCGVWVCVCVRVRVWHVASVYITYVGHVVELMRSFHCYLHQSYLDRTWGTPP